MAVTRRALVTGASRGIGRAVTLALLQEGWRVAGVSRSDPKIESESFRWFRIDVARPHEVQRLEWDLDDSLDAVVHCAAIRPEGPLSEMNAREWRQCVAINLLGTYTICKAVLPLVRRSDDGRILLFAGGGAFSPSPGYSAYAASKAGVVSLMETVAEELEGTTTTVNCISPGYVPTPMTGHADGPSPEMDRAVACVMYLLSPAVRGLTGKTVSAEYDAWASITPEMVESLNSSLLGTRHRYQIKAGRPEMARVGVAV